MAQQDTDVAPSGYSSTVRKTLQVEAYKKRFATLEGVTYIGLAAPGTAESAAAWQIRRENDTSGNVDWADGDTDFDNVWDDRASLTYS